jgi:glycosyltransferase involved in cell wall biosynthesis
MRILMILDHEFPPDIRVENEMETLSEAGHEIHLACFTRKNRPEYEKSETCHIHRKAISGLVYKSGVAALTFPFYFQFWRGFITRLVREFRFDAIHVHDLPLTEVAAGICRKENIPLTVDLHENWPAYLRISAHTKSLAGRLLSPNRRWVNYEKRSLAAADHIVVVVKEAARRLASIGLNPDHIKVVSNTLNLRHFRITPAEKSGDKIILFYAGGLTYHRGLQVVIRAIAEVAQSNIKCWILGEGSYKAELEILVSELGLEEQVIFKGWQPYEKMTQMMMDADYTLIPHLRSDHTDSTIPHKLFQYMYAGKPIIASDCKPIKRIVNETDSGYIYTSDQPEELAKVLQQLKNGDPGSYVENGRKWVTEKYNWSVDSKVLLDLYHQK